MEHSPASQFSVTIPLYRWWLKDILTSAPSMWMTKRPVAVRAGTPWSITLSCRQIGKYPEDGFCWSWISPVYLLIENMDWVSAKLKMTVPLGPKSGSLALRMAVVWFIGDWGERKTSKGFCSQTGSLSLTSVTYTFIIAVVLLEPWTLQSLATALNVYWDLASRSSVWPVLRVPATGSMVKAPEASSVREYTVRPLRPSSLSTAVSTRTTVPTSASSLTEDW